LLFGSRRGQRQRAVRSQHRAKSKFLQKSTEESSALISPDALAFSDKLFSRRGEPGGSWFSKNQKKRLTTIENAQRRFHISKADGINVGGPTTLLGDVQGAQEFFDGFFCYHERSS